jgi:hypothetical protein
MLDAMRRRFEPRIDRAVAAEQASQLQQPGRQADIEQNEFVRRKGI